MQDLAKQLRSRVNPLLSEFGARSVLVKERNLEVDLRDLVTCECSQNTGSRSSPTYLLDSTGVTVGEEFWYVACSKAVVRFRAESNDLRGYNAAENLC